MHVKCVSNLISYNLFKKMFNLMSFVYSQFIILASIYASSSKLSFRKRGTPLAFAIRS